MNVLAIGAHPDDLEILCAGTLALYAQAKHNVTMAVFTDGSMGDVHIPPAKLARIRFEEQKAAAEIIGARLLWPAITDEHVFPNEAQRRVMIDLLREADPDVIFTHSANDYHPDHRYLAQLVFDSYFQKGLPHIANLSQPACRFGETQVYYMDTIAGIGFVPTEYVDITSVMETKLRMLPVRGHFRTGSSRPGAGDRHPVALSRPGGRMHVRRRIRPLGNVATRSEPTPPAMRTEREHVTHRQRWRLLGPLFTPRDWLAIGAQAGCVSTASIARHAP